MDLKLFLDRVDSSLLYSGAPGHSFQSSIFINSEIIHDLDGIDIAIIGAGDFRGSRLDDQDFGPVNMVRKSLYQLTRTSGSNRVLDMGNLRNGPSPEETAFRLRELCSYLLEKNILPIIVGGSQDLALGQFQAYEGFNKLLTVLNVDPLLDLFDDDHLSESFLDRMFKHDPNILFNYVHLGYHLHRVNPDDIAILERLCFEAYRIGTLREMNSEIEPIIRDGDAMIWDLSSLQSSYVPCTMHPNPFGFTGEEACQVSWYAGHNDKMTSLGLYNLVSGDKQDEKISADVAATMIWYFIDGFYHRKGDKNFMSNDYLIYEVSLDQSPESIRFYKSKLSEKWWMEIPDDNSDSVFIRNKMVPCSYKDYQTATEGEVPQRWLNAATKLS